MAEPPPATPDLLAYWREGVAPLDQPAVRSFNQALGRGIYGVSTILQPSELALKPGSLLPCPDISSQPERLGERSEQRAQRPHAKEPRR